ncbi:hypothetical protein V6N11_043865 [Hibiscus sabdariffa]|uniref:Uncharacterized protein n=1 Tax=Hibiscus sabdariffa TaxID=183260 RepID=A0ABR2RE05_9ROSI
MCGMLLQDSGLVNRPPLLPKASRGFENPLVEKDPERAIPLFWAAINAGDRVDSALKDMAIVMKQQNRAEEAIEAIKSLQSRCSDQAQESLDNILLDLYKVC